MHHHQKVFAFLKLSFEYYSENNFSTSLLPILKYFQHFIY